MIVKVRAIPRLRLGAYDSAGRPVELWMLCARGRKEHHEFCADATIMLHGFRSEEIENVIFFSFTF